MKLTEDKGKPEPDIFRLRAEARALLCDPSNGPILITQLVGALSETPRAEQWAPI